jgi:alpha-L-rhamnosidase
MTIAQMIAPFNPTEAAPLLRREFTLDRGHGPVERAVLRTSALGVVEAWVNGIPSADELLAPGWTSYEWRVRVAEHDVTDAVAEHTAITLRLGNGWYRGWLGFTGQRAVYGDERAGYAELVVAFADGHIQRIVSDESWRASTGEVLADDLYNGETIDARLRDDRWQHPGFDDADWSAVRAVEFDATRLVASASPPV